jgi:hypothetical protein
MSMEARRSGLDGLALSWSLAVKIRLHAPFPSFSEAWLGMVDVRLNLAPCLEDQATLLFEGLFLQSLVLALAVDHVFVVELLGLARRIGNCPGSSSSLALGVHHRSLCS